MNGIEAMDVEIAPNWAVSAIRHKIMQVVVLVIF